MPLMQADLALQDYLNCLTRLHGIVAAWEKLPVPFAPVWMRDALIERRRLFMLESDLEGFGVKPAPDHPELSFITDEASLAGAMYVMEGSTLGGQFIARHVQRVFDFQGSHGNAFFCGFGERTGSMWKELCHLLESNVDDSQTDSVVLAAKQMFHVFGEWMRGINLDRQVSELTLGK
jgi:heme oxygenase